MKCFHPVPVNIVIGKCEFKCVPVPCGKCEACLSRRAHEWQLRLKEEMNQASSAFFITLTYNEENLPIKKFEYLEESTGEVYDCSAPMVEPKDVQLFLKRLRKRVYPHKIRYYCVSEYGPKNWRPHYHMILFNLPRYLNPHRLLEKTWGKGFVTVSKVTIGRIAYVTKYCFANTFFPPYLQPNFTRMSLKPAIGHTYLEKVRHQLEYLDFDDLTFYSDGKCYPIPKYYRKKFEKEYYNSIGEVKAHKEKIRRMEDYIGNRQWSDFTAIVESRDRQKYYDSTGIWYQTPSEVKKERFIKNFWKKYDKTRKEVGF